MPPNSDNTKLKSTIGIKHSLHRDLLEKDVDKWFEFKKLVDGAEGLWRIHNGLYDLSDFIKIHPGGQFWLETTKGTDITEAFESHHISTKPENMLKTFYIRDAKSPRSAAYTFNDNGFYRTLKREVREALKSVPKNTKWKTNIMTDVLMLALFVVSILANRFSSYTLGFIAGLICGCITIAAHNYTHQRDNFRMYYMDCVMFQSRGFRIVHILSHHLYTNTVADLQATLVEPIYVYFPQKKSWIIKYASAIYVPALLWPSFLLSTTLARLIREALQKNYQNVFDVTNLLPLILPTAMHLFSEQPLLMTLGLWLFIIIIGSCFFCYFAFTNGHYHPDIFMDGDTPRPEEEMDWGICQLDTVCDRYEIEQNLFFILVFFGHHALHHLFPTFDIGMLEHLRPVIEKVIDKFNLKIRMVKQANMYQAYLRQVAREEPNPNPPDLHKELD